MTRISTREAAKLLGISPQRVRVLLASGRLAGAKDQREIWLVNWPAQVVFGKRGPPLRLRASSKLLVQSAQRFAIVRSIAKVIGSKHRI